MSYNGAKWGYLSNIVEAVRGRRAKFIKLLSLICIKKSMISDWDNIVREKTWLGQKKTSF